VSERERLELTGLEVLVLDIGGTVVREGAGFEADGSLRVELMPMVAEDLGVLATQLVITAATNTTGLTSATIRGYLDRVGVGRYFGAIVTSFDRGLAKPDPTIVTDAARAGGATSMDRVLMIGDRSTDQDAALAGGAHFAWASEDGLIAAIVQWQREMGAGGRDYDS
jgi:phosphoglycolate phosphatase-like HAD superfamily hydrolase